MRSQLALAVICAATLSACATQTPAPAAAPSAAAAAEEKKKVLQCWNGDQGKFQDVGTKATISGVAVECKPTSDGKSAAWVSAKH